MKGDGEGEYIDKHEEYQRVLEERHKETMERDESLVNLRNMEASFAEQLMTYENVKACQGRVEKNCEVMNAREEVHMQALKNRDERDKAAYSLYANVLTLMKQEFEGKVKDVDNENTKLKAMLRMTEMKAQKLEAEVGQVDKESESLRKLCNDMLKI